MLLVLTNLGDFGIMINGCKNYRAVDITTLKE